jgi:hypothetical protein
VRRLVLLLVATIFAVGVPSAAWAAIPADPRITAATKAWSTRPLYVDPDFAAVADGNQLLRVIEAAPVPVYVAAVPTGQWFREKGDTTLLAGWLAASNGKPGVYVVMDGDSTYGVAHEVAAYAPDSSLGDPDQTMSSQLADYLGKLKVSDKYEAEPARTEPDPPIPASSYPEERFTVGKAIGSGAGGGVLGLLGGALLAGIVLGVAAIVARRRGGQA